MWNGMESELGLDLGTCNTLIYRNGHGLVLNEPSVVAVDQISGRITAFGEQAYAMIGRTPQNIEVIYPLQSGSVANFDLTQEMLQYFIRKVFGARKYLIRPKAVISVPYGITNVNKRAVENTAIHKGHKAMTIEEPVAAAIGAGLPLHEPIGSMIIDIGGGTLQVVVMSMGGIVVGTSLSCGGMMLDQEIIDHVKKTYNVMIGERTAQSIKHRLGTAIEPTEEECLEVRGRGLVDGLPHTIHVSSMEIYQLIMPFIETLIQALRHTLESCPPELAGDVIEQGAILCGGGALLRGLPRRLQMETGIPCHLADQPLECVALGAGQASSQLHNRPWLQRRTAN